MNMRKVPIALAAAAVAGTIASFTASATELRAVDGYSIPGIADNSRARNMETYPHQDYGADASQTTQNMAAPGASANNSQATSNMRGMSETPVVTDPFREGIPRLDDDGQPKEDDDM